jgi:hypothetical protein
MIAAKNYDQPLPESLVAELVREICARLDAADRIFLRGRHGPAKAHGTTAARLVARYQARDLWPPRECACKCGTIIEAFGDDKDRRPRRYVFGHSAIKHNIDTIQPYLEFLSARPGATTSEVANCVGVPLEATQYTLRLLRDRWLISSEAEERAEQGRPEHGHKLTHRGRSRMLRQREKIANRAARDAEQRPEVTVVNHDGGDAQKIEGTQE